MVKISSGIGCMDIIEGINMIKKVMFLTNTGRERLI